MRIRSNLDIATLWEGLSRTALLFVALSATLTATTPAGAEPVSADGPVYFVIYQNVRDEARFAAYVEAVMPAIARRGGELVAAGTPNFMEGSLPHGRAVVFRYPSGAALERFLASDEYAGIRKLREGAVSWLAAIVSALPANVAEKD